MAGTRRGTASRQPAVAGKRNGFWFALVSLFLLAGVIVLVVALAVPRSQSDNPIMGKDLYVYPESSAAEAVDSATGNDATAFGELAGVPTAIWLLPEAHPTAQIAEFVDKIEADATAKSLLPVFVVYGVPSRDCGNFSAGGSDVADYPLWISAIARGIADRPSILILEPDALALAPSCGTEAATTAFIRDAITRLASPKVTIYLDGGHSNWLPASTMADLLREAGVDQVRGFATNVSNYNTTAKEQAYGQQLSALLGGAHYVIDTGRNGNGSTGEWCNPPGRRIGDTPSGVADGTAQDASLWIKNPGESDGECNGGPPAGQWWPSQALELVRGGS